MSTSTRQVHNPDPNELVYTRDGHILAGCTGTKADLSDPVTRRLVDSGQLLVIEEPTPAPDPQTEAAEPEHTEPAPAEPAPTVKRKRRAATTTEPEPSGDDTTEGE